MSIASRKPCMTGKTKRYVPPKVAVAFDHYKLVIEGYD